jgi:hypothetical protein
MKQIIDAIYTKLASVQTAGSFHGLLDGRYYHLTGPQNVTFPNAIYGLDGMENSDQFGGSRILNGALTFDIYCEAKAGVAVCMDIEEALYTLLDQQQLTVSAPYGPMQVQCVSRGVPSFNDEFVILTTTYSLFSTRTA